MKTSFYNFLLGGSMLALTVTACTSDDVTDNQSDGRTAVQISANPTLTRAVDTDWSINDQIGITMLKGQSADIIDSYKNYNYKTEDASSSFVPSTPKQIMYFPVDGSQVSFKAYYPFKEDLPDNQIFPVSIADQSNLPALDLMTAEHVAGTSKDDPNVQLKFHHRLSKIYFNLSVEDEDKMSLDKCSMVIKGMKTAGSYDLMAEVLTTDAESVSDITVPISNAKGQAIVLPRTPGAGVTFEVTLANGGKYTAILSSDFEIQGEHKHIFNINLKKTPVVVSAIIEDWLEGPEKRFNAIRLVTGLDENKNINEGNKLNLYLKDQADFTLATQFTYHGNLWETESAIYWENITANPAQFRGTIILNKKLNDTQMDDILTSDIVDVDQYTRVNLTLKHAGSKAVVELVSSNGSFSTTELADAMIKFPDYLYSGSINEKGEFVINDQKGNIMAEKNTAIFPSQTIPAGQTIATVTINGCDYNVTSDAPFDYEQGVASSLKIDMSKTEVKVSTKVIDWDKAEHPLTFKVVVGSLVEGFKEGDHIQFYHMPALGNVTQTTTGTCKKNGENLTLELADNWYIDDMKTTDKICAVYPTANVPAVPVGSSSFPWNAFNTTTSKSNDDILIATTPVGSNPAISIDFKHALSKVIVNIIAGEGFETADLTSASISLTNFAIEGTIDVTSGKATAGSPIANFTPNKLATPNKIEGKKIALSYDAMVMPQVIANATNVVSVSLNGKTYNATVKDIKILGDFTIASGNEHTINITFAKTGINFITSVTGWTNGEGGDITIE